MPSPRFNLMGAVSVEKLVAIWDRISSTPNEPSELHILSKGGNLDAAYDFYQAVRREKIQLKTIAYNEVSSAAFMVLLAGVKRTACRTAKCLLHQSSHVTASGQHLQKIDVQKIEILEHLHWIDRKFARIIARESGNTIRQTDALSLIKKGVTLTCDDLLRYQLIHQATV